MKHPAMLLIPLFMLMDYYLTIYGAIQKDKKYANHFKHPEYELNPDFQKDVAQRKWFNPKHLIGTFLVWITTLWIVGLPGMPDVGYEGVMGFCLIYFGVIVGRHLANILVFRYLEKHPDEVSGKIFTSHCLDLHLSAYQYLIVFFSIALIYAFFPTPFVIGGLCGSFMIIVVHYVWIFKFKAKEKAARKASEQGADAPVPEA